MSQDSRKSSNREINVLDKEKIVKLKNWNKYIFSLRCRPYPDKGGQQDDPGHRTSFFKLNRPLYLTFKAGLILHNSYESLYFGESFIGKYVFCLSL